MIMKTVFINENMYKQLKESILLDSLPEDIVNCIFKGQTSLKNNAAIPNIFDENFIEHLVKKHFLEVKNELKKIGSINDFNDDKIENVLSKLVIKCQKIEQLHKAELEKICFNYVTNLFKVPDDTITLQLDLVEEIDGNNIKIEPDTIDVEFSDIEEAETLKKEVEKRRILDVLNMGAAMKISSNIKSYISDIYDVDPTLCDLYRKIIFLNEYLLFVKEDLGIDDNNKLLFGSVAVKLGQPDEKVVIEASGKIFPVLLSETIRGFMELFASHGLPKDKNQIDYVLNKADYLKAEPWDMRIGPQLWEILTDCFENVDSDLIPYLYRKIAKLPVDKFSKIMSEIFIKSKKGKEILYKLTKKAKEEKEYYSFVDKMSTLQTDKNIINDEYIHPDEL